MNVDLNVFDDRLSFETCIHHYNEKNVYKYLQGVPITIVHILNVSILDLKNDSVKYIYYIMDTEGFDILPMILLFLAVISR